MWVVITGAFGWFRKPWWAVGYYVLGLVLSIALYGRDIPNPGGFFMFSIIVYGGIGVAAYFVGQALGDWRRRVRAKQVQQNGSQ